MGCFEWYDCTYARGTSPKQSAHTKKGGLGEALVLISLLVFH